MILAGYARSLVTELSPWAVSGTYLEACNCDAICPCRRIAGRSGGRSTHGICQGALSWRIQAGNAGGINLSGLDVVMATWYDDAESGSPWTFYLYVDEDADAEQRVAIAEIWQG